MIKIGFPRGLLYYDYYPLWETFFNNLNIEVVTSPRTNKDILNAGIEMCVDEACLPVKIFHGHVNYLKDKVDYIFIPQYISLHKKEYNCPKHLGIASMVSHSINDLPPLITPKIKLESLNDFWSSSYNVGKIFTNNYLLIKMAYKEAIKTNQNHINWLKSEIIPTTNIKESNQEKIRLLVLGHTYNVYDDFVNMGILKKLLDQDIEILYAEDIQDDQIRYYSDQISKRMFWTQGRKIIGSAYSLIESKGIDGIIYLSAFGCGLDSVLIHIVEHRAVKDNIPIMIMTFDEQTGEAGFNTRFEAFLDMMKWRIENENNFSSSR